MVRMFMGMRMRTEAGDADFSSSASSSSLHMMHPRRRHVRQHAVAANLVLSQKLIQQSADAAESLAFRSPAERRLHAADGDVLEKAQRAAGCEQPAAVCRPAVRRTRPKNC